MDQLGLDSDQLEKLRQYTEFTDQHDYDVAVGTLASLNWNLEQAIEAHLMQEDINDDDEDPEILETIPPSHQRLSGGGGSANATSSSVRIKPEFINIEAEIMPATRGRRRGRVANADETTVDNQIDDQHASNGVATMDEKGAELPRKGKRSQASEPTASHTSSSSASSSATSSRRHTRANPAPSQEPAHPEPARQNGASAASTSRQQTTARTAINSRNNLNSIFVDSDEDDDVMNIGYDDEDDDDENNHLRGNNEAPRINGLSTNGRAPMIPDGFTSIPDALRNFVSVFADRFCSTPTTQAFMPPFYTDSLQNAATEAFENPNTELRRPLVIYINHDRAIASNIFASQVMCSEAVSSLIRHQYILFPWDISSEANLMRFLDDLQTANMGDVRNLIQRLYSNTVETFPMMVIVVRERNTYRVVDCCRGTDTADQVLETLLSGVEEYSNIRRTEDNERRERVEREAIRNQQEAEYQASLAADQARIDAKRREIEEQRLAEEKKRKEEEEEALRRQLIASKLPDEPPASTPASEIVNIKFRLPSGALDLRRFLRVETIQTMIDYLSSKGFSPDKFKYFNSDFPKKEVTRHFDLRLSFTDSKWPVREQIFVEEM